MDTIDALVNDLPDEVVSLISDLADENQTLQKRLGELETEVEKAQSTDSDDSDLDPIEKALNSLDPEVATIVKAQQERLSEAEKALAQAAIEKRDTHYTEVAKGFASMGDPTTLGPVLRRVADVLPEDADTITKAFTQAHARLESADIFKELGSTLPSPGSVDEEVSAIAKSYMESDDNLSEEAARSMVWEQRPDLYEQHVNERQAR